jgi:hypothetical protein
MTQKPAPPKIQFNLIFPLPWSKNESLCHMICANKPAFIGDESCNPITWLATFIKYTVLLFLIVHVEYIPISLLNKINVLKNLWIFCLKSSYLMIWESEHISALVSSDC